MPNSFQIPNMVTTRAQSRVKSPVKIGLESPFELMYFAEVAAYIVYEIGRPLSRLPLEDEDFEPSSRSDRNQQPLVDSRIRGKLLRLRKQAPTSSAVPVLESHEYFKSEIEPLFPQGILVEQELCELSPELLKKYNKELRRDEKRQFLRNEGRAGTYLAEDEPHGLLVTEMLYDDQHASCDFKPKWLTQSPFAPESAKRCRNCAMQAKRGISSGFRAWCPLALTSDDEELLRSHLDGALRKLRGAHLRAGTSELCDPVPQGIGHDPAPAAVAGGTWDRRPSGCRHAQRGAQACNDVAGVHHVYEGELININV